MTTLALTALHRSMLAEINAGQVGYEGRFLIGGAVASVDCDKAIRHLIEMRLVRRDLTVDAAEVPVVLTDAGEQVTR